MSTKISSIYDNLHTRVAATLTTHYQLINPYVPELNDDLTYDAAWGLAVSSLTTAPITQLDCQIELNTQFNLTITRKLRVGDLQRGSDSVTARRAKEKALCEDFFSVFKAIEQDVTLSGVCTDTKMESNAGIEFVRGERFDLIMIRTVFTVRYFENIT